MTKETSDKISFISFIVPEFAAAYKMKISDAYRFLNRNVITKYYVLADTLTSGSILW